MHASSKLFDGKSRGKKHSAFDRKPREERSNRKSGNTLLIEILEIVGRRSSSKCCVVDWKIRFALDYFPPIPTRRYFRRQSFPSTHRRDRNEAETESTERQTLCPLSLIKSGDWERYVLDDVDADPSLVILDVLPRTKGFRRNPITTFGIGHAPLPPRKRHETQPHRCPVRKKEIKFSVSSWFSSIFATYRREETDSGKETRNCVSMMKCATVDIVDDLPPRLKRENISQSR